MQLKPRTNPEAQWIKWWKSWQCQRCLFRDLGWLRLLQYLLQMKALAIMCTMSQCLLCCSGSQTEPRIPGLYTGHGQEAGLYTHHNEKLGFKMFFKWNCKTTSNHWSVKLSWPRRTLNWPRFSNIILVFLPLKRGPWCEMFGKPCLIAPFFFLLFLFS